MGMRKGLHIISTDLSETVEDHGEDNVEDNGDDHGDDNVEDHGDGDDTVENHGEDKVEDRGCQSNSHDGNEYLRLRQLTIEKNNKKLRELGIKNIIKSSASLEESQKTKKKTMKKQYRPQYIPPMSSNRVANLMKLRRVVAPNVSQKLSSTSNTTKPNKQPTVTMSEIIKGDKGGAKKKLVLVDEDDEIFQGDIEVDDVDQHEIQMADHDYSNDEDSIHEQIQGLEKQKATSSNVKGNSIGRRKRLHITSTISTERVEDHVDDDQVEDHQVFETQGHQASEIQGAPKRVRGYTTKAEIWKMDSTKRIAVTFNKSGKPVGAEANELAQFLGTLARMADHVSIEYSDWRKIPIQKKEDMYSLVKSKFVIHPNETNEIKNWIFQSIGKKWREWKGSLKACAYDPSLTVDEIVAQQVKNDDRVNPTQFKELVTRWFTPEFQTTCDVKRMSRSKMKEPHVSGTKSFARLAHEMAMKNNGIHPTRGEMYIKTRTRKDGSIVDDNATQVVVSLKKITNDSTTTLDDPTDFTNDDYSKVKGPEKRGYVRLVGRMPAAKSNTTYSQTNDQLKSVIQTNDQLKSVVNAMAIIIQEHIPNANLSSVLSSINMQVPGTGSLVHNNSLSSSRSQYDNGQESRSDN